VPLKIDAEKQVELAKRYQINAYPTLLLLKPDGTEVDRLVGFREAAVFVGEFNKLLAMAVAGKSGLAQAKEAMTQADPDEARPHFELAQKLARAGNSEEALKELLWCWDEGKKDPDFTSTRSTRVSQELASLARSYPPAKEAMTVRRDQARERVLAGKGGSAQVQDLIALNRVLREDDDSLAVFGQLPVEDRRRVTFSIYLFDQLVEKQRYADALLGRRLETAAMLLENAKSRAQQIAARMGEEAAQGVLKASLRSTARFVEALAGAGRLDEARALADKILAVDASEETRTLLREHVTRAGHPELLPAPSKT
jgi:hypothetical protein